MPWRTQPWTGVWWGRVVGLGFVLVCSAILAGTMSLVWLAFFDNPSPLESTRMTRLEVVTPPVGNDYLVIAREFCFSHPSEGEVSRIFRRVTGPEGGGEVIEVAPMRVHFDGPPCYTRPRRIDLPAGISPGLWLYTPAIRWQNAIGRPVTVWNSSVLIDVRAEGGRLVIASAEEQK